MLKFLRASDAYPCQRLIISLAYVFTVTPFTKADHHLGHHDWSSPPLGHPLLRQRWPTGSSRHNFAASAPFPDLSTPLNSLISSDFTGWSQNGEVNGRKYRETECKHGTAHAISFTQHQTLILTSLRMCKVCPHCLCGFGRGKLSR